MKKFRNITVLGAGSAIAGEIIRILAADGAEKFSLISRSEQTNLSRIRDIKSREPSLHCSSIVASGTEITADLMGKMDPQTDLLLIAVGRLTDSTVQDPRELETTMRVNFIYPALFMNEYIRSVYIRNSCRHNLTIAVIGSVAGCRARASNYCYGAGKAAVSEFAEGLNAFCSQQKLNIGIRIIRPGLVATPMISHRKDRRLVAEPAAVARTIVSGLKKDRRIIYCPWYWRWIMLAVKIMPYRLFKKINS